MPNFVMIATSNAKEGQDEAFNKWYDTIHLEDVRAIPGVKSARRLVAEPNMASKAPTQYLTIYELEADHPDTVIKEMFRRHGAGEMRQSDTLNPEGSNIYFYKPV